MGGEVAAIEERLKAGMPTHTLDKGGIRLSYVTAEQVTSRLNEALGVDGWSFRITERWYDREADECCVRGTLTVTWPSGRTTEHEDIGSQIPNRKRGSAGTQGEIIEIGNDWKGARSDCLKRCAVDIGVGLWLYAKQGASLPPSKAQADGSPEPTRAEQQAELQRGHDPAHADALARARRVFLAAKRAGLLPQIAETPAKEWDTERLELWCRVVGPMLPQEVPA